MKYPRFTGWEPCAQTDPHLFINDDSEKNRANDYSAARLICDGCPLSTFNACREWAVLHEQWGFWGGMSPHERRLERERRGVRVDDPSARPYVRVVSDPPELLTVAL